MNEILLTDYLENDRKQVLEQFQHEGHWQGEVIQYQKNGKKLYIQSHVSLLKD